MAKFHCWLFVQIKLQHRVLPEVQNGVFLVFISILLADTWNRERNIPVRGVLIEVAMCTDSKDLA